MTSKTTSKMTSSISSKLDPTAATFVPSLESHMPAKKISNKNTTGPIKYRSRNGELWEPPKGWIASYRCGACHQIMTRKEASKCPQRINTCGHIMCAKCIVSSYLVELNPLCPVEGCGKCVNPKRTDRVAPVDILTDTNQIETDHTEIVTPLTSEMNSECGFCSKESGCDCNQICLTSSKDICQYYDEEWGWNCDTLWCGCIDVCRGRCGFNNDRFDR